MTEKQLTHKEEFKAVDDTLEIVKDLDMVTRGRLFTFVDMFHKAISETESKPNLASDTEILTKLVPLFDGFDLQARARVLMYVDRYFNQHGVDGNKGIIPKQETTH